MLLAAYRTETAPGSIRRLAERADCPFSRSTLNEAVGVHLAVAELPSVRTFGHIGAAHVASVLTLPAPERLQMLQHAEQQHWSVRELRNEVVVSRIEVVLPTGHIVRIPNGFDEETLRRPDRCSRRAERAMLSLPSSVRLFVATQPVDAP